MCLRNIKKEGENVEFAWKIFCDNNGLYPFKIDYAIKGKPFETNKWISNPDGFHSYINKEDAELTVKTIRRLRQNYKRHFSKGKLTVRQIQVKEIFEWGFNIRTDEDLKHTLTGNYEGVNSNAIKFKEMKIL